MSHSTISLAASTKQPVLFIPHGAGPCFFMDWNPADAWDRMAAYLRGIAASLPTRPKAIVMVSAHWQTAGFTVTTGDQPDLIFDYYGFPEHTYELAYPAAGAPALAERIATLLVEAGLPGAKDAQRGFDHGMFIPLKLMFPEADIPVVQLSLREDLDPAAHLAAGKALSVLRDEGVLIVGSGMSFHNMSAYGNPQFTPLSEAFDDWLSRTVEASPEQRWARLSDWSHAPHAYQCHPPGQEEHLMPLMVAAGAAGESGGRKVYTEKVVVIQLSAFRFD